MVLWWHNLCSHLSRWEFCLASRCTHRWLCWVACPRLEHQEATEARAGGAEDRAIPGAVGTALPGRSASMNAPQPWRFGMGSRFPSAPSFLFALRHGAAQGGFCCLALGSSMSPPKYTQNRLLSTRETKKMHYTYGQTVQWSLWPV